MNRFRRPAVRPFAAVALMLLAFVVVLESQDAEISPTIDAFKTQCNQDFGPAVPCTISVWRPSDLVNVFKKERSLTKDYVDKALAARLDKLSDDLVAKAVAANVKQSVVNDIVKTLPNDPEFAASIVSALAERAKQDSAFADTLKQLVQDPRSANPRTAPAKSVPANSKKQ